MEKQIEGIKYRKRMRGEETIEVVDGEESSNRLKLKVRMNLYVIINTSIIAY